MTFWQPPNRVSCKITGWTIGVSANTNPTDAVMRVYRTFISEDGSSTIQFEGGGVNCILFSLQFLWEEYRLFHNAWSQTNDGHDLARYFGTKIYLQPHRYADYIFWWDRDWQKYTNEHFLRCHPVNLFSWKTKVFIRSQAWGQTRRTKKVFIKPPATQTNQWRHMKDWYYTPLFCWGISVIDWYKYFARGKSMPYCPLPQQEIKIANIVAEGQIAWVAASSMLYYNAYYDNGEGNELHVQLATKSAAIHEMPSTGIGLWRHVTWADNIPYWMAFYGQNKTWDMGVITMKELDDATQQDTNGMRTIWFRIKYPQYTSIDASNIGGGRNSWLAWKIQVSTTKLATQKLTINYGLAYVGPFVAATYTEQIEIPILYQSKWQWGGQTWSNMEIINPGHFTKSAVTVKNPQTVARSIIYPGDTGASGLLTDEALQRLVEPSKCVEERRPQPWAGLREDDPYQPEYEETASEAETDQDESDEECETEETLRHLRKRLQREQYKRRKLFAFFRSLLNARRLQERGGGNPLPPANAGPPHPYYE